MKTYTLTERDLVALACAFYIMALLAQLGGL